MEAKIYPKSIEKIDPEITSTNDTVFDPSWSHGAEARLGPAEVGPRPGGMREARLPKVKT